MRGGMKGLATALLAVLAVIILSGCANMPGKDGQYATHDHGQNNHP